ncbi:MAG TPA: single-stranded DNA-binding protein [Lachnospiraceae bacterium]|nr:single-stranded DNA-binding protein [Lachnospiraceae bacterium]
MNKCIFLGRLTRNPEIRYTTGAKPIPVANYTLAVDRRFKREGEPTADFLNFVAYAKAAEFADRFLKKGTKIVVTSRVQTRNYTNKDGQKVYVTEFVVEDQEFAESKGSVKYEPEQTPEGDGFMQIPDGLDEELPFN